MDIKQKYGSLAVIAGASEGIGAAYAEYLAAAGLNLILIARRKEPLQELATQLIKDYGIQIEIILLDLANPDSPQQLNEALQNKTVGLFIYNAALSYIGPFEIASPETHFQMMQTNMITPLLMIRTVGEAMLAHKRGAIILMASLAGFQGSGYLSTYAATKAFDRMLAESLWYEWKDRGVDVIACCAGATATPNFIKSNPEKKSFFAPKVQHPMDVVAETFKHLGKTPSFITGRGNRIASFIMQRVMPRKMAIMVMGDTTRKMYRL